MSFHPTACAAGLLATTFANARSASSLHDAHLKAGQCSWLARWVGSMLSFMVGMPMPSWVPSRSIVQLEPLLCVVNTMKRRAVMKGCIVTKATS